MKKMITIYLLICCVTACSAKDSIEDKASSQFVASIGESLNIEFNPGNGWRLTIMPNGSGSFSYGSLPFDGAFFSVDTLNYTEIYSTVIPQLHQSKSAFKDTAVAVIVSRKGQSSYIASYFDGASYWNALVETLIAELTAFDQKRFDAIIAENPLKIEIKAFPNTQDVEIFEASSNIVSLPEVLEAPMDTQDERNANLVLTRRSQAHPIKNTLDAEKINEIKEGLKVGSTLVRAGKNEEPLTMIEEAFEFLNINVNMAYVPERYFEDDEMFYFSGGTTAHQVVDFSSGIAVSKKDGSILSWNLRIK